MPTSLHHVERFQRHAGLIQWRDTGAEASRLDARTARILHVAAMLEEDTAITVQQGRALGLLRSADMAAFLPQWAAEESEHAIALRHLLGFQEYEPPQRPAQGISLRRRIVARMPVKPLGLAPQTSFLFCVLGAAAEYEATVIYSEVAKSSSTPFSRVLHDIARQEARHFRFFLDGARLRGTAMSPRAGRIAVGALRRIWEPLGVPTLGVEAWTETFSGWLADPHIRRRIEMTDRVLDSIPHLEGARLMGRFLDGLPGGAGEPTADDHRRDSGGDASTPSL